MDILAVKRAVRYDSQKGGYVKLDIDISRSVVVVRHMAALALVYKQGAATTNIHLIN